MIFYSFSRRSSRILSVYSPQENNTNFYIIFRYLGGVFTHPPWAPLCNFSSSSAGRGRSQEQGRRSGDVFVNLKIFSKISNLNWFFSQPRKDLPLHFWISCECIKDFQISIKVALIFLLKLAFSSKNSLKIHAF